MIMNACCVWDFTAPQDGDELKIAKLLNVISKKWCFQLERGETTGFMHYQGRFSLKVKKRLTSLKKVVPKGFHLSPTSNVNKDNDFYVTKEETRVDGPWNDKMDMLPRYVPRQIREIKELYAWQKEVIKISRVWDTRTINVIIDTKGNIGKSILCTYMGVNKMGCLIPFCNDYKDILRMVMDRPKRGIYLIDMPRAVNKERLAQMFSAIETVKSGYAYDDRYKFREEYFDCPNIWVFTNKTPELDMLSQDRWKFWEVENNELIVKEF